MLQGLLGRNSEGKKMAGSLIAAVIPTAVIGLAAAVENIDEVIKIIKETISKWL